QSSSHPRAVGVVADGDVRDGLPGVGQVVVGLHGAVGVHGVGGAQDDRAGGDAALGLTGQEHREVPTRVGCGDAGGVGPVAAGLEGQVPVDAPVVLDGQGAAPSGGLLGATGGLEHQAGVVVPVGTEAGVGER